MLIYGIINAILMTLGNTVKFPVVYRSMLRFNVTATTIAAAVVYASDELAYMPFSPLCDNKAALMAVYLVTAAACVILAHPDRLADVLIMDCFYQFLYNTIGSAVIAVLTVIYGAVSGADSNTWFSRYTSTDADYIIRYAALIISFGISLILCRKCLPLILNIRSRLKHLLFVGTVIPVFTFMIIRHIADTDTAQMLSGFLVICYGILLTLMAVSLLVFFISVFLQTKEENRLMQARIEGQNEYYHRVLRLQQELREAKHDLANQLAAYNISQSKETDSGRL